MTIKSNQPPIRIAMPKASVSRSNKATPLDTQKKVAGYIKESDKLFKSIAKKTGKDATQIYMGPENQYKQPMLNSDIDHYIRQISSNEYQKIKRLNIALSKEYPDIVLKPGSAAYFTRIGRPETLQEYLHEKGVSELKDTHPERQRFTQKFIKNKRKNNAPFFQPDESLFTKIHTKNAKLDKAKTKNILIQKSFPAAMLDMFNGQEKLFAKNKSHTYLNGKIIAEYSKLTNSGEIHYYPNFSEVKFLTGANAGGLHFIHGSNYTQDLCKDNGVINRFAEEGHFTQSDFIRTRDNDPRYTGIRFHAHASTVSTAQAQASKLEKNLTAQGVFVFTPEGNRIGLTPIAESDNIEVYEVPAT